MMALAKILCAALCFSVAALVTAKKAPREKRLICVLLLLPLTGCHRHTPGPEATCTTAQLCTECGKEVWPQLATAIIVLIHKGDEVLLVHARNFKSNFMGLVAGFVETGETLEEAVHREVKEETNLEITNLRYFSSQPWPYPCGLMVGFNADYVSGEIKLQTSELARGAWFRKDNLPTIPEKLSIARKLIDAWLEGEKDNGMK